MDVQACQLWLQICSHLEDGSKFEAAAHECSQRADTQSNLQELKELVKQRTTLLLLPPLLGRVYDLPPWPKPVWRELLKAEVSAASSHWQGLLMPEGSLRRTVVCRKRLGSLLNTVPIVAGSGVCYQFLASEACCKLVQRALKDGILCPEDTNSSKDASLTGLRQSFWQQVVRSGLLQRLPALLNQAEKLVQTQTASSEGSSQSDAASLASGHGGNTSTKQASSAKKKGQHGTAASSNNSGGGKKPAAASSTSTSRSTACSEACQLSRSGPIDVDGLTDAPTTPQEAQPHWDENAPRYSFYLLTIVRLLMLNARGPCSAGQSRSLATDVAVLQLAMACICSWSAYIRRLPDGAGCELEEVAVDDLKAMMQYIRATLDGCQLQRSTLPLPVLLPCCVLETLVCTYSALLAEKQHLPGGMLPNQVLATPTATSTAPHSHASHRSSSNNSPQASSSSSSSSKADGDATQQPSVLSGSSTKAAGNRSGRAANAGRNNTVGSSVQAGAAARTSSEEQLSFSQVWHIACTQQQAIPEDHMRLLELLGVDGRTILVMAAQNARRGCVLELEVCHRMPFLGLHLSSIPCRDYSLLQPPEVALLTAAPAVLCYWVAHTNSYGKNYPAVCKLAAQLSRNMLLAVAANRAAVCCQQRIQGLAALEGTSSIPQAKGAGTCAATGPELQPDAVYPSMLDRVLCSVLKVLRRLNRKLLRHVSSPAGGSPAGDSSKQETLLAVERVVQLAAYMGSSGCHQASRHSHSQGPSSNAEAEAVWQRLAIPLSNGLECFVRSQAAPDRLADVTSRACSAVSHAAACLSSVDRKGETCCLARVMMQPGCSYHHRAQLLSLVFSLIKYGSNSRSANMSTQDASNSSRTAVGRSPVLLQAASDCCYTATTTAMAMLDTVKPPNTTSSGSPHSPDNQLTKHCQSSSSSGSAAGGVGIQSSAALDLGFACLAAFGRCCMEWAQQLQETPLTDVAYVIKLPRCGQWLIGMQEAMPQTAAGCDFIATLEQIHRTVSAVKAVTDAVESQQPGASLPAAVADLVQQLQKLGEALNTLPHPHACNNPHCSTTSGPSDVQLVSGKSCLCAGCLSARYCSRTCQKQHRKQHREVCKARAAAAAAAALQPAACPEVV